MIPLTELCVSRELAERMKDLGFEQKTVFYWKRIMKDYKWTDEWMIDNCLYDSYFVSDGKRFSAPIAGEIDLPFRCDLIKRKDGNFVVVETVEDDRCGECDEERYIFRIEGVSKTEAEAKGIMWCYLKENKRL
jgi:hypothetical protein